jgi:hypothetical protein
MVAIAIFSMVVAAIYSVWMAVVRAAQVAQDVASQAQRERVTLHTFQDAIDGIQSFQASPQYYSFVIENNNDTATLSFTSRLPHEMFPRNGKFINPNTGRSFDLRRLIFNVEQDKNGENSLMLRQFPVLMDMDDDEQKYPLELAKNVRQFTVECWGTNQQTGVVGWMKEWDDTNAIPQMLRVNLVMGGNVSGGRAAPDVDLVRVYSVPSQMMPAIIQKGGLAGTPPPGGNSGIRMPTPNVNK